MLKGLKTFSAAEAAKLSGVKEDFFIDFYVYRGHIMKEPYGYSATALGIEKYTVVNDDKCNALFTVRAIIRIANACAV